MRGVPCASAVSTSSIGVEFLVFDGDLAQGFLRGQFVFGDHGRDRLAHEADLADRNQRMISYPMAVIGIQPFEIAAG